MLCTACIVCIHRGPILMGHTVLSIHHLLCTHRFIRLITNKRWAWAISTCIDSLMGSTRWRDGHMHLYYIHPSWNFILTADFQLRGKIDNEKLSKVNNDEFFILLQCFFQKFFSQMCNNLAVRMLKSTLHQNVAQMLSCCCVWPSGSISPNRQLGGEKTSLTITQLNTTNIFS